ncbi:DUF4249 family protein [Raineya sp.]|jgi:hypothetical protein
MKPATFRLWQFWLLAIMFLSACGLERDIDLKLPEYEKKLVVECYLERGKPIRLLLTESQDFLDNSFQIPEVKDAQIVVKNGSTIYPLHYEVQLDTLYRKAYNYVSDVSLPANPTGEFHLEIIDSKGRKVTGKTQFLEELPIKETLWQFEDADKEPKIDTAKAYVLIRHNVSPSGNFYRFIINKKKGNELINQLDFIYRGITATNGEVSIGTSYRFKNKDTLQVLLFHIERQFYNYLRSVEDARDAAGNPFAQPSPIISGVQGGIGIFTTIQKDEQWIVIKKN